MVRRLFTIAVMFVAIGFLVAPVQRADGHPSKIQCGPYVQPGICGPLFTQGQRLMIQPNVPFVWLRGDPSSSAEIRAEVVRSSLAILTVVKFPSAWDGYQNWWLVGSPNTTALTGWVEQASLLDTTAIAPTPTALDPAVWGTPFSATIRRGLPFVWIRSRPDSNGTILDTLVPNDRYTVLGTPEHVFDGRQWWWYVRKTYPSGGYTEGYIEEQSIIPLG